MPVEENQRKGDAQKTSYAFEFCLILTIAQGACTLNLVLQFLRILYKINPCIDFYATHVPDM